MIEPHNVTPHAVMDYLIEEFRLKNDAALSRRLGVAQPVISKTRNSKLSLGPNMILRIHETFDVPVSKIRELMK